MTMAEKKNTRAWVKAFKSGEMLAARGGLPVSDGFDSSQFFYKKNADSCEIFDNGPEQKSDETLYEEESVKKSFADIGLHKKLLKLFEHMQGKFILCNEIDFKVIDFFRKNMSKKVSLKLCAPIKSGKTCAILIGMFEKMLTKNSLKFSHILILYPTFDIAEKSYKVINQFAEFFDLKICLLAKGASFRKNIFASNHVVVATPEKLESSFSVTTRNDWENIHFFIFEDADCMNNPRRIFSSILDKIPSHCRVIVTMSKSQDPILNQTLDLYLNPYETIEIKSTNDRLDIKQIYIQSNCMEDKVEAILLLETLKSFPGQTVVFCNLRDTVYELCAVLKSKGLDSAYLTGKLKQNARKTLLESFKKKDIKVLLTTCNFISVIDSDAIMKIVNFDQVLDPDHHLNFEEYERRLSLLKNMKRSFILSFIDKDFAIDLLFGEKNVITSGNQQFYQGREIIKVEKFLCKNSLKK